MKLNKKGFTLIELLAVVIILLAISVIAVSSISAAIERNKAKQNAAKIDIIISYAEIYFEEHKNQMMNQVNANGYVCIELEDDLSLSGSEILDANGSPFEGEVKYSKSKGFEYVENCS